MTGAPSNQRQRVSRLVLHSVRAAALIAGLLPFVMEAQALDPQTFTVGTATARRGTQAMGAIDVPAGSDSGLSIPVAVFHGARPGPVVAFMAGGQGTEYSSIIALQRLILRLDPARLAGTVIIVPLLNVPSFLTMTARVNPVDGTSMVEGADPNGTQSQRALALAWSALAQPADAVVDLHGGDFGRDLHVPYSIWVRSGRPAQDSASSILVRAFGVRHVLVLDRDPDSPETAGSLVGHVLASGKTLVMSAVGAAGVVAPTDLATLVDGSLNVLGALQMIDRPTPPAVK